VRRSRLGRAAAAEGRLVTQTVVRIETRTRWDAVDLTRNLPPCRWYMVAMAPDRWDVCVRAEPAHEQLAEDLLRAARAWAERRDVRAVAHLPGGDVELPAEPPEA
jgi:hypothetical protein